MRLLHGRVEVELHSLKAGEGEPLLLLHALGEASDRWDVDSLRWPGPVYALDFAGHGQSGRVRGGGYCPEYFLADADLALAQMGDSAAVVGAGIGGYVALLLAGARQDRVRAALILPGRGLAGGGVVPDFEAPATPTLDASEQHIRDCALHYAAGTDRMVASCEQDIRPLDYVEEFAAAATEVLFSEAVSHSDDMPEWWNAAVEKADGEVVPADFVAALARLQRSVMRGA